MTYWDHKHDMKNPKLRAAAQRIADLERMLKDYQDAWPKLQTDLAEVDSMLSAHAFTIDRSPPDTWPKSSVLRKAIDRHAARVKRET